MLELERDLVGPRPGTAVFTVTKFKRVCTHFLPGTVPMSNDADLMTFVWVACIIAVVLSVHNCAKSAGGCCWVIVLIVAVIIGFEMNTYQRVEIAKAQRREGLLFAEQQANAAAAKAAADVGDFFNAIGRAFGEMSNEILGSDSRQKQVQW